MAAGRSSRRSNVNLWATVLAVYLFTLPVLLMYLLVAIWPDIPVAGDSKAVWGTSLNLFTYSTDDFPPETRLLLVVIVAGALGSFVHAATSFALADHTLGEMLAEPGAAALARGALAYVGPDATLADAKAAMEDVEGCQDVFVTGDGDSKGAVAGWLTNGTIAKLSRS